MQEGAGVAVNFESGSVESRDGVFLGDGRREVSAPGATRIGSVEMRGG